MFDFQSVFSHPVVKNFNPFSVAVFDKLSRCHTRRMGYHRLVCQDKSCGKEQYQYHNCGDRNCPNCGGLKRDQWIENRTQDLLPTPYYHLVFTLPQELNSLILGNRKKLFNLLFEAASSCILTHSNDPQYLGGNCGITMVLHTWGQNLSFHPHVHCIVSGGGFDGEKWIEAKRKKSNFLFPETSLSNGFRALFLKKLVLLELQSHNIDVGLLANNLQKIRWNVYAKAPFAGPKQVIDYLGRYTHKVAITKHRIVEVTDNEVVFKYKDYADGNTEKVMRLKKEEFLRRFEQHILPRRYTKIRYFGFLQNHGKRKRLTLIRSQLKLTDLPAIINIPVAIRMLEKMGVDIYKCPCCPNGRLVLVNSVRYYKSAAEVREKIEIILRNKASPKG